MLLTAFVVFVIGIFNEFLLLLWRLSIEIFQSLYEGSQNVVTNWRLYSSVILIVVVGLFLFKANQAKFQTTMDIVYECGFFEFEETVYIFFRAWTNLYSNVLQRYNDITGYLRSCLADLIDGIIAVVTTIVDDIIVNQQTITIDQIVNLYEAITFGYLTFFQISISIPSLEVRFLTTAWTGVVNYATCMQVLVINTIEMFMTLTVIAADCDICNIATSPINTTGCYVSESPLPDVTVDCNNCHNLFCDFVTCQMNFVSNITYLIVDSSIEEEIINEVNAITQTICCVAGLVKRPFFVIVGLIQGSPCLVIGDLGPEMLAWVEDIIDCLDDFINAVTFGFLGKIEDFIINYVLPDIGLVVTGMEGLVTCIQTNSGCFNGGLNCATGGFGSCFVSLDTCMKNYTLWSNMDDFFSGWEKMMNGISNVACWFVDIGDCFDSSNLCCTDISECTFQCLTSFFDCLGGESYDCNCPISQNSQTKYLLPSSLNEKSSQLFGLLSSIPYNKTIANFLVLKNYNYSSLFDNFEYLSKIPGLVKSFDKNFKKFVERYNKSYSRRYKTKTKTSEIVEKIKTREIIKKIDKNPKDLTLIEQLEINIYLLNEGEKILTNNSINTIFIQNIEEFKYKYNKTDEKISKYINILYNISTTIENKFQIDFSKVLKTRQLKFNNFYAKLVTGQLLGDFNPLNPEVYQPSTNLAYRNESVNLGIFLTGLILNSNLLLVSVSKNDTEIKKKKNH